MFRTPLTVTVSMNTLTASSSQDAVDFHLLASLRCVVDATMEAVLPATITTPTVMLQFIATGTGDVF